MSVIDQYAQMLSARTRPKADIAKLLDQFFLDRMSELDAQIDELAGSGGEAFQAGKKAAEEFMKSKETKHAG
jgi:hypothetical protein